MLAVLLSIIGTVQLFNEPTVLATVATWMPRDYTPMMMAYNTMNGNISPSGAGPASAVSIMMALVAGGARNDLRPGPEEGGLTWHTARPPSPRMASLTAPHWMVSLLDRLPPQGGPDNHIGDLGRCSLLLFAAYHLAGHRVYQEQHRSGEHFWVRLRRVQLGRQLALSHGLD